MMTGSESSSPGRPGINTSLSSGWKFLFMTHCWKKTKQKMCHGRVINVRNVIWLCEIGREWCAVATVGADLEMNPWWLMGGGDGTGWCQQYLLVRIYLIMLAVSICVCQIYFPSKISRNTNNNKTIINWACYSNVKYTNECTVHNSSNKLIWNCPHTVVSTLFNYM